MLVARVKKVWCRVHGDVKACSCKPDETIIAAVVAHYRAVLAERARKKSKTNGS